MSVQEERIEIARVGIGELELRYNTWREPPSSYELARAAVAALGTVFWACECGHIRNDHGNGIVSTACRHEHGSRDGTPPCGCSEWAGVEYCEIPQRAEDLKVLIEVFDAFAKRADLPLADNYLEARKRVAETIGLVGEQ